MEDANDKSNLSTTGTPTTAITPHLITLDDMKYTNPNFNDDSESSSQVKRVTHSEDYPKGIPNDEPKKVMSVPNKIFPTDLAVVLSKSQKISKEKLPEKTLAEMGYIASEVEGWEKIVQPPKKNLYSMLKDMIVNHIKPNIQIRLGSVSFNCHMMVLQCYSEFFMNCNNEMYIQLPEEKITPRAFMMIYEWMLADEPLIQREGILELFTAATFLRIPELVNQCWLCMDDDERFREDTAFLLYLEARKYNLECLEQLMLMRICKFFLTLVASKEFLTLSIKEVCNLLSSNTIGVNSEIEIFMSVIRWLSYDWEERSKHVMEVVQCVRFSLMPPWFLVSLTKHSENDEIDRVIANPEIRKLINDGISFTTTQLYYGDNPEEFLHFLERYNLVVPMQRQWVFDKACKYHNRIECPNMKYITYESFLQYLEMVQTTGKDYWRTMEMAKSQRMKYCVQDTRKAVGQNFVCDSELIDHRDQSIQCENVCKRQQRHDHNKAAPLPKPTQSETIDHMNGIFMNSEIFTQDDSYYAIKEESVCIVTCRDNVQVLPHLPPLETNAHFNKTLHSRSPRRNHKLEQSIKANDISESFSKYLINGYYGESGGDTNDLHSDIIYGENVYHKSIGNGDRQVIYNKYNTPCLFNEKYSGKYSLLPKLRKNPYNTKTKSKLNSNRDKLESYSKINNEEFYICNSNRNSVRHRSVSKTQDSYTATSEDKGSLRNAHCFEEKELTKCHFKDDSQLKNRRSDKKSKNCKQSSGNCDYFKDFNGSDHSDKDAASDFYIDKMKWRYQTAKNHSHNLDRTNCIKHGVKNRSMSRVVDSCRDNIDSHSNLRDNRKRLYYSEMQQDEHSKVNDKTDFQSDDKNKLFSTTKHCRLNKPVDGGCINHIGKSKLALKELDYCQKHYAKELNKNADCKNENSIHHKRKARCNNNNHNNDNIDVSEASKHCAERKLVTKVNCPHRIDYQKNNDERIHDPSDVEVKIDGLADRKSRFNGSNSTKHNGTPSVGKNNQKNDTHKHDSVIREYTSSKSTAEPSNHSKNLKYRSHSTGSCIVHKDVSSEKNNDNDNNDNETKFQTIEKTILITGDQYVPLSNSKDDCDTELKDNNCSKISNKSRIDFECYHAADKHDIGNHSQSCQKFRTNFSSTERCHPKDNATVLRTSIKPVKNALEQRDCLLEHNYKVQKYKIILFGGIDPYCCYCQYENDDANNCKNFRNMHISKEENIGNQVLMYDENNLEWKQISCLPLGSRHHHSAVVCNSLIYVIGGTRTALGCSKKSVFEKSVWCFNPRSLKWTLESNLPESRRDFAVIAVDDSIQVQSKHAEDGFQHDIGFYIIGGEGTNNIPLSTVWFYNIPHKVWIKKPSLNVGRYGLAATLVNHEIWVAGGVISCSNSDGSYQTYISRAHHKHVVTDVIEVYSLSNNKNADEKWSKSKLHLRGPRVFAKFCKTAVGGLYMIGGLGFNEKGIFTSMNDVDYLNFETMEWKQFGNLNWSRHGHDVGTLDDHCFVVVGGVSTMGKHALNNVEVFCTKTRTTTALPSLPFPLSGSALIALHS